MNTNKLPYIIGGGILLLLVSFLLVNSKTQNQQVQNTKSTTNVTQQATTGSTTSQDPEDIVPGLYKNQIQNTATQEGIVITTTAVENNTDTTGKAVSDHLELTLKNTAGKDLTDFEIYYTIADPTTNKKEGYYKKLTGFVLKSSEAKSINFDNKQGDGHFSANKNSIYYSSTNKLLFTIMLSAPGYKPQTTNVEKSAGGAEQKD